MMNQNGILDCPTIGCPGMKPNEIIVNGNKWDRVKCEHSGLFVTLKMCPHEPSYTLSVESALEMFK